MKKNKSRVLYPTKTDNAGRVHVRDNEGVYRDAKDYASSLDKFPSFAHKAMGSEDGKPALCFVTYQTTPCGCKIVGCGTLQFPLAIEFCKKHWRAK